MQNTIEQPKTAIVNWLDIETTGLDPNDNQVTEIAIVQTEDGKLRGGIPPFHVHVYHNRWVVSPQYVDKFGAPKNHPDAVHPAVAIDRMLNWIREMNGDAKTFTPSFGGKNLGIFDVQFLKVFAPGIKLGYQLWDIGNLYAVPSDPKPPNLTQCINRARIILLDEAADESSFLRQRFPYVFSDVKHTALEDARQCVELYELWCEFGNQFRARINRAKWKVSQDPGVYGVLSSDGHRTGI